MKRINLDMALALIALAFAAGMTLETVLARYDTPAVVAKR